MLTQAQQDEMKRKLQSGASKESVVSQGQQYQQQNAKTDAKINDFKSTTAPVVPSVKTAPQKVARPQVETSEPYQGNRPISTPASSDTVTRTDTGWLTSKQIQTLADYKDSGTYSWQELRDFAWRMAADNKSATPKKEYALSANEQAQWDKTFREKNWYDINVNEDWQKRTFDANGAMSLTAFDSFDRKTGKAVWDTSVPNTPTRTAVTPAPVDPLAEAKTAKEAAYVSGQGTPPVVFGDAAKKLNEANSSFLPERDKFLVDQILSDPTVNEDNFIEKISETLTAAGIDNPDFNVSQEDKNATIARMAKMMEASVKQKWQAIKNDMTSAGDMALNINDMTIWELENLKNTNPEKYAELMWFVQENTQIDSMNATIVWETPKALEEPKVPDQAALMKKYWIDPESESDIEKQLKTEYDKLFNAPELLKAKESITALDTQLATLNENKANLMDDIENRMKWTWATSDVIRAVYSDEVEGIDKQIRTLSLQRTAAANSYNSVVSKAEQQYKVLQDGVKAEDEKKWKLFEMEYWMAKDQYNKERASFEKEVTRQFTAAQTEDKQKFSASQTEDKQKFTAETNMYKTAVKREDALTARGWKVEDRDIALDNKDYRKQKDIETKVMMLGLQWEQKVAVAEKLIELDKKYKIGDFDPAKWVEAFQTPDGISFFSKRDKAVVGRMDEFGNYTDVGWSSSGGTTTTSSSWSATPVAPVPENAGRPTIKAKLKNLYGTTKGGIQGIAETAKLYPEGSKWGECWEWANDMAAAAWSNVHFWNLISEKPVNTKFAAPWYFVVMNTKWETAEYWHVGIVTNVFNNGDIEMTSSNMWLDGKVTKDIIRSGDPMIKWFMNPGATAAPVKTDAPSSVVTPAVPVWQQPAEEIKTTSSGRTPEKIYKNFMNGKIKPSDLWNSKYGSDPLTTTNALINEHIKRIDDSSVSGIKLGMNTLIDKMPNLKKAPVSLVSATAKSLMSSVWPEKTAEYFTSAIEWVWEAKSLPNVVAELINQWVNLTEDQWVKIIKKSWLPNMNASSWWAWWDTGPLRVENARELYKDSLKLSNQGK